MAAMEEAGQREAGRHGRREVATARTCRRGRRWATIGARGMDEEEDGAEQHGRIEGGVVAGRVYGGWGKQAVPT